MNDTTITDAPEVPKITSIEDEEIRRERQHFIDEAFFRALPIALTVRDWTRGGETGSVVTITTQTDQIKLAWEIAQEAYTTRLTVK